VSTDRDKPGFFASFKEGYKEGHKEADDAHRKDTAPMGQKIAEGTVSGVSETFAHPFRWLRSVLKK
jgi:hypothetical protein